MKIPNLRIQFSKVDVGNVIRDGEGGGRLGALERVKANSECLSGAAVRQAEKHIAIGFDMHHGQKL